MDNFTILNIESVNSTNNFAKEYIKTQTTKKNVCINAYEQFSGKGQRENTWLSEKGKNLSFSVIHFPKNVLPTEQFIISQAVSVAIITVLSQFTNNFKIKWPNDIYFNKKKIGGILIENSISGKNIQSSIIGIGLNINQLSFDKLLPNPISLVNIINAETNLEDLLKELLVEIKIQLDNANNKNHSFINSLYLKNLHQINEFEFYKKNDNIFKGKIIGTEKSGLLIMELENGDIKKYDFKEIVFL